MKTTLLFLSLIFLIFSNGKTSAQISSFGAIDIILNSDFKIVTEYLEESGFVLAQTDIQSGVVVSSFAKRKGSNIYVVACAVSDNKIPFFMYNTNDGKNSIEIYNLLNSWGFEDYTDKLDERGRLGHQVALYNETHNYSCYVDSLNEGMNFLFVNNNQD